MNIETLKGYAAESGHWYTKAGEPAYTIVGKNGLVRNTTLRDARRLGLLPSVSGIIKMAAAPALTAWLVDQALLSALTLPRIDGETLDAFKARAKHDSKEQSRQAAADGTELHGSIERAMGDKTFPTKHLDHVHNVLTQMGERFPQAIWSTEKSFASPLGYGGKIDLSSVIGNGIVGDYKGKPLIEDGVVYGFDENLMQLCAYAHGIDRPNATLVNLFIGLRDAKVYVRIWTPEEAARGWKMFQALLAYWQASTGYDGTVLEKAA